MEKEIPRGKIKILSSYIVEGSSGTEPGESGFKSLLWYLNKSEISSSLVCLEYNRCIIQEENTGNRTLSNRNG